MLPAEVVAEVVHSAEPDSMVASVLALAVASMCKLLGSSVYEWLE